MQYSDLSPSGYIPRIADKVLERYLKTFGGVEICGMRWCGKSWTAASFGESITRVDTNEELYKNDPSLALVGATPHVIDEWQDVPSIWNCVRHAIDDHANMPGQFILAGSSTPNSDEKRHSGAGRIGRLRMRTMTLYETQISTGAVSLTGLFDGHFEPAKSNLNLAELSKHICQGGWPALQHDNVGSTTAVNEYLESLFEISIPKEGKSADLARMIALSLARNIGTAATLKTIAADVAEGGSRMPSEKTITAYLETFRRNYFIDSLHGWDAPIRSKSRLRSKPKRYLGDPSLAAALLGVDDNRLLQDAQLLGLLFESLCIRDIAVYLQTIPQANNRSLYYYGDANGLEVDVIIELNDGKWAAIEIKLGESKVEQAAASLLRLKSKVQENKAARNPNPEFMAIIVGKSPLAYQRKQDGIYVIPIDTLGP